MKKLVALFLFLVICISGSYAATKHVIISVTNNWNKEKANEPVVLNLKKLGAAFDVQSAVVKVDGKEIASQLDDLDNDLINDELAFVLNVPANAKKNIDITLSSEKSGKTYPQGVYADMMIRGSKGKNILIKSLTIPGTSNVYSQMMHHGPAFESELTAYRIYFDEKQTVDLYGKFHKGFELKESQWYPSDSQLARGFGDDVLNVKGSCGLGTLKGWDGANATHIKPVDYLTETIVAYGPVRTVVDIIDTNWKYQGSLLNMRVRYILYSGHRDCQVQVSFKKPLGNEVFATGVQKVGISQEFTDHKGLVADWGNDWPVNDTVKYHKETVGLATVIPAKIIKSEINDKYNYLYQISASGTQGFTYYISFTSMKETFGYKTPEAWFNYAKAWKEEVDHPVSVACMSK